MASPFPKSVVSADVFSFFALHTKTWTEDYFSP